MSKHPRNIPMYTTHPLLPNSSSNYTTFSNTVQLWKIHSCEMSERVITACNKTTTKNVLMVILFKFNFNVHFKYLLSSSAEYLGKPNRQTNFRSFWL